MKAALVEALQAEFDVEYPYPDFRGLHVSIEYPVEQIEFPGIFVDYDDRQPVEVAGIGHTELVVAADGAFGHTTRWRFAGDITLTVAALSSQERDRLYDELVRIVGFGKDRETLGDFRRLIESNDFVAMNINFDSIKPGGKAEAPGTPWGTEEYIYEKSVSLEVQGEFIGDPTLQQLVRLRRVDVDSYRPPHESEPAFTGNPRDDHLMPPGTDPFPTRWR
jgi:hypothetical protein